MRFRLLTLPQFKLSGVMLAVVWLGVCFLGWRLPEDLNMPGLMPTVAVSVMRYVTIPTAIGALFGYAWRGLFVGIVLWFCWLAWGLFMFSIYGKGLN
jgi:hypothetical protein